MVEITLDGKKVEVPEGSMVMHAAAKADTYVPHFCYHKKLSIAANCRMCLVEVEKAPKPLPACATPVTQGMVVHTKSEKAIKAQQSVMEFLLINHPLDCPICDQGGECQLQDLAVGYGGSASRYEEEKRVVFHKSLGPLVSAEEMSRCIHCTRCVRFGQEIAGVMELGMLNRGEHAEITSFLGNTVDSELSGNMIDICPVGALTSKPFRYSARTWELNRRKSVSPHDSVGANIIVQVKNNQVMRVVPLENEEINECWISDRDRFSYEGLNSADRLTVPMIKENGQWKEVDWPQALEAAAAYLKAAQGDVNTLVAPNSTLEEMLLAAQITRALGSDNIDFRLRQTDFSGDAGRQGAAWLGMPIAQLSTLGGALIVGSFLRNDHPLFASRLRQAAKSGAKFSLIHTTDDDLLMPVANKLIVAPSQMVNALAQVAVALAKIKGVTAPAGCETVAATETAQKIAEQLSNRERTAVLLGNTATAHAQAASLNALAQWIAQHSGASFGFFGESGNTVGGFIAGALPASTGKNAAQMTATTAKAYLLVNVEPALDLAGGEQAAKTIAAANAVIALTAYKSAVQDVATIMLPIAPFTETSGTYINAQGTAQSTTGVVKALGQSRPGWKVLRVLGNNIGSGFDYESSEQVRDSALKGEWQSALNNQTGFAAGQVKLSAVSASAIELTRDVPIYRSDAVVRRAQALGKTAHSKAPTARMSSTTAQALGVQAGAQVRIKADQAQIELPVRIDDAVAANTVRVSAAHLSTAAISAAHVNATVERA